MVVKRTWARAVRFIEFFSDVDDPYVPTVKVAIPNTERGKKRKTKSVSKFGVKINHNSNKQFFQAIAQKLGKFCTIFSTIPS